MNYAKPAIVFLTTAAVCVILFAIFALAPTINAEPQVDMSGLIIYLDNNALGLTVYHKDFDLSDLDSANSSALTGTNTTRYIPLDDSTRYYRITDGAAAAATKDDLAIGDLITVTTDDNGIRQITRLNTDS